MTWQQQYKQQRDQHLLNRTSLGVPRPLEINWSYGIELYDTTDLDLMEPTSLFETWSCVPYSDDRIAWEYHRSNIPSTSKSAQSVQAAGLDETFYNFASQDGSIPSCVSACD